MSTRAKCILNEMETARIEGCRWACDFLSIDSDTEVLKILTDEDRMPELRYDGLLREIGESVNKSKRERNVTDWPFENFWKNPHEPKHSKLLGYFIDSTAEHGCGQFLLEKLLEILNPVVGRKFTGEGSRVTVEKGHIDLLITQDCIDGKYAIIFENKINSAIDQDNQLERYVESVIKRGFDPIDIFVFYLPLTDRKNPDPSDEKAITDRGVNYYKITFVDHVLDWLNESLDEDNILRFSESTQIGMRENLSHYRNLIRYLNEQEKERRMNSEIIEKLKEAAVANDGRVPTLQQVKNLIESANALQQCVQATLRVKLLLNTQKCIKEMGFETFFTSKNDATENITSNSCFDPRLLEQGTTLHVRVESSKAVTICVGIGDYPESSNAAFWLGYGKRGDSEKQKDLCSYIMSDDDSILNEPEEPLFYKWGWCKYVTHENCSDESIANRLACDLRAMHLRLQGILKKQEA